MPFKLALANASRHVLLRSKYYRVLLYYEINEQIEFHTFINSVTEEEQKSLLNGNRSLCIIMVVDE